MKCTFVAIDERLRRCTWCGTEIHTHHPPERCHVLCRGINLNRAPTKQTCNCNDRKQILNRIAPHLGDATEAAINLATLGQGKRLANWWANWWQRKRQPAMLLRWPHGLGDSVQGTVLLQHLRHYHPEWAVDVAIKDGHDVFQGLARRVYPLGAEPPESQYDIARALAWYEPDATYHDSPATKAEKCLREVFRLSPIESLCRYSIQVRGPAHKLAQRFAAEIGGPFALIHYQGNTASQNKSIDESAMREVVALLRSRGLAPVILDWETPPRSGLLNLPGVWHAPNGHYVWGFGSAPSAEGIAALARLSSLNIGIDSGPGHVMQAFADQTPTVILWDRHHPLNYAPLSDALHIVRADHANYLRGDQDTGLNYFRRRYRHAVADRDYRLFLPQAIGDFLANPQARRDADMPTYLFEAGHWVRARYRANDLGIVAEQQSDEYQTAKLPDDVRTVIDLGAHIGAFAVRARKRWPAARIICVEANPRNIDCLQKNAPGADVLTAAVSYEPGPVVLLNSIFDGATAGPSDSEVVPASDPRSRLSRDANRHRVEKPPAIVTVEAILDERGIERADVLKIDCEGCEWGVLESIDAGRVRYVVGEYHRGSDRLRELAARRFPDWRLRIISDKLPAHDDGAFWLISPTEAYRDYSHSTSIAQTAP